MTNRVGRWPLGGLVLTGLLTGACGGGGSAGSPVAAPTPTPPLPTPTPAAFVCPLPPSVNLSDDCSKLQPQLGSYVNTAVDTVLTKHPELFNFSDALGGNPKVLDRQKYHEAVKQELEAQGVCTLIEKEELAIKNTNEFNEQWNVYTSGGYVMRRYVTTCSPAWW
jgi:hypothetical protein